jgi:sugar phosphate isomerase/epimerase
MNRLGIERLCVFGMGPVEMVTLAADLGCAGIGIALTPMRRFNPHDYADWSLREDAALRREMIAAMRDRGVRITLLEGFGIAPGRDVAEYAGDLDLLCALGGERINLVSLEPDMQRTIEGFATMAQMAAERGLQVSTEIGPGPINGLDPALTLLREVAAQNLSLLLDTMHYFRFGGTIEALSGLAPGTIGYVQLCDVPLISPFASYMDEALHERMVPGEGELPLRALMPLLPEDVVVSLEVPRRSLALQGVGPLDRVRPCVEAARALLWGRTERRIS